MPARLTCGADLWGWGFIFFRKSTGEIMLDSTEFRVVTSTPDKVELSFRSAYDPTRRDSVRLAVDKRLVLLRGVSGFYPYAVFSHSAALPPLNITEARLAFKLGTSRFRYMAVSDKLQRAMPSAADRDPPRGRPLAYKEAVLLVNPAEPEFKGEVDDKYMYSLDNKDNKVHGWISEGTTSSSPAPASPAAVGFWVVTPSNEFKSGGPMKRELTSHVGPTALTMFMGTHYVGDAIVANIGDGENWTKVLGPVFVYLNSVPEKKQKQQKKSFWGGGRGAPVVMDPKAALWEDAKARAAAEAAKWPYNFPESPEFHKAGERATVAGRLLVRDRYLVAAGAGEDGMFPARNAYVGLAAPGQAGSWATESKGYQFWTRSAASGGFAITGVRAGLYSLYAWVPGVHGEFVSSYPVNVTGAGEVLKLGDLVFAPPRAGPTVWEMGIPDRSAAEFFVPDPNQKLVNRLFLGPAMAAEKFRQYGLWDRYAELYPNGADPVFTVGASHYSKDWFFAHVTRKLPVVVSGSGGQQQQQYAPTTRQIKFALAAVASDGNYTLRIALAAAQMARLRIEVNPPPLESGKTRRPAAVFTTPEFGEGNAIARHGDHGTWWSFEFGIQGRMLVEGENVISITQVRAFGAFLGVMYDYIRLEAPPASRRDPTAAAAAMNGTSSIAA
ncbi:hypothetical protein BRADI_4g26420v3 [Brachypodium distachyon]|uniref:Rhamnogalacturonan endolyase n=1 Tax=Brachypodium distachyon TaxID=15368 RepID=A0A2K2CQD4_BRADI|nr:hypothetical protein BRADI_4g26420v3 [Brachypodium distachyon]